MPTLPRVVVPAPALLALILLGPGLLPLAPASADGGSRHTLTTLTSQAQFTRGADNGTAESSGSLRLARSVKTTIRGGVRYDTATWTSPWIGPRHTFTEVVPSWQASTPKGTWIIVRLKARSTTGTVSTWQNIGRWSSDVDPWLRTSDSAQTDAISRVATDTLVATGGAAFDRYQIQVALMRKQGTTATPVVRSLHGVASRIGGVPTPSRPARPARTIPVPAYSQMTHRGEYPDLGGGGEAWCSPTSLAMILGYYHRLPPAAAYRWVTKDGDPWVDETARRVFDHEYDGTGNWPFNTAYAAVRGLNARVTRLPDLRAAEAWIARGVPLEVSIAFSRGQLDGAPIGSTPGHLVVLSGFTRAGNVVVNDPAAPTNASVRRVYDRAQFEAAWQRRSHGLTYLITR